MNNGSLLHLQAIYLQRQQPRQIYLTWLQKIPPPQCKEETSIYYSYKALECNEECDLKLSLVSRKMASCRI